MALKDLFLFNYRTERVLEHPIFTTGNGMHYDAKEGKLMGGVGYSKKEKSNFCKVKKVSGIVNTLLFTSLFVTSLGFGSKYGLC